MTCNIFRSAQLLPLTFVLLAGCFHAPAPTLSALMPIKRLIQQRYLSDGLAAKGGRINEDTAIHHHLLKIAQAEGKCLRSAYRLANNINEIVQNFKGCVY